MTVSKKMPYRVLNKAHFETKCNCNLELFDLSAIKSHCREKVTSNPYKPQRTLNASYSYVHIITNRTKLYAGYTFMFDITEQCSHQCYLKYMA